MGVVGLALIAAVPIWRVRRRRQRQADNGDDSGGGGDAAMLQVSSMPGQLSAAGGAVTPQRGRRGADGTVDPFDGRPSPTQALRRENSILRDAAAASGPRRSTLSISRSNSEILRATGAMAQDAWGPAAQPGLVSRPAVRVANYQPGTPQLY